jgi:hypothetical protein
MSTNSPYDGNIRDVLDAETGEPIKPGPSIFELLGREPPELPPPTADELPTP